METQDWKKFIIPAVVLVAVLALAYPLLSSAALTGMSQNSAEERTVMGDSGVSPMPEDQASMENVETNDIVIDADADGRPEAALTQGDVMMRDGDTDTLNEDEGTKTITLNTQNNSSQAGTATLTEENGKVKVMLALSGGMYTAAQPAHIHVGSCPTPGAVKYPLTNVMNGRSETMLNVDLKTLMASSEKLSLNVHKSAAESQIYTACGNLK